MRTTHAVVALAMLAVGAASTASAAPSANVETYAFGTSNISPPDPTNQSENLSSNSGGLLSSSSSVVASNALWSISAASSAQVQAGMIQLYASGVASAHDNPSLSYVTAVANTHASGRWQDSFTIDGGALNGQVGHLVAGFKVDGTLGSSFDSSVNFSAHLDEQYRAWIRLTNGAGTGQDVFERGGQRHLVDFQGDRWLATDMPVRAPGLWTVSIDFKFGTPIQMDLWGDIYAYTTAFACDTGYNCVYPDSNVSATADFGHTIYWAGVAGLTDASGNPVSNYTISSASGFDYSQAAAVPEPESAIMMLVGLGLLGVQRWRNNKGQETAKE